MRRHDLTKKDLPTYLPTYLLSTYIPTLENTIQELVCQWHFHFSCIWAAVLFYTFDIYWIYALLHLIRQIFVPHFLPSFLALIFDPHFWPSFLALIFDPHFWPSFLTLIFYPHFLPLILSLIFHPHFWQFERQYWRLDIWDTDYNSDNWEPEFRQSFLPDN